MDATLEPKTGRSAATIIAPDDCTEAEMLRELLDDARRSMRIGPVDLTIDLSQVRRMNARLLATLLLLVREVGRAGGKLRLVGATDEFRNWASIFNVLVPLQTRGVLT